MNGDRVKIVNLFPLQNILFFFFVIVVSVNFIYLFRCYINCQKCGHFFFQPVYRCFAIFLFCSFVSYLCFLWTFSISIKRTRRLLCVEFSNSIHDDRQIFTLFFFFICHSHVRFWQKPNKNELLDSYSWVFMSVWTHMHAAIWKLCESIICIISC